VSSARGRVFARAGLVLAFIVVLDQATKALVRGGVDAGEEDSVLPAVSLVHVRNTGVAFGAFSGGGIIVVVLVTAALCALLTYFVTHMDKRLVWLPTGMLLGGSIGNIIDRVRDGAVTDFVKLPAWPAFNVADVAITFGVLVLLWVIEQQDGAVAVDREGEGARGADGQPG
jgi:signal peptidase II